MTIVPRALTAYAAPATSGVGRSSNTASDVEVEVLLGQRGLTRLRRKRLLEIHVSLTRSGVTLPTGEGAMIAASDEFARAEGSSEQTRSEGIPRCAN
jgi:hypothetical protein